MFFINLYSGMNFGSFKNQQHNVNWYIFVDILKYLLILISEKRLFTQNKLKIYNLSDSIILIVKSICYYEEMLFSF